MQTSIDDVISDFVANKDVLTNGTNLKVTDGANPYTVNITGTINPVGVIGIVEVNTELTNNATSTEIIEVGE